MKLDSLKKRLVVVVVLIILLFSLSFYFTNNMMNHVPYHTTADVVSNYPLGEEVTISGTVFSYEENGFLVGETYNGQMVYYHIVSNLSVVPGDYISFKGILGRNYTVTVIKSEVVSPQSYEFEIWRSLVVVPFLVIIFFIYWRFDLKKLAFVRRK
jgi:hypothetical protein